MSKDNGRGMETLAGSTLSLLFSYGNRGGVGFCSSEQLQKPLCAGGAECGSTNSNGYGRDGRAEGRTDL